MRPVSLTIEGLTSFRAQQEIDFSTLDLFVITGPTGAGKSSILDAVAFALYGSVPRVNSNEVRDLISHGCAYMRVRLDFEVEGKLYRVARRIMKNSHQATLERVENGSSVTEVEQGGVKAVNKRLEEIVGLDFKAFTKAVLLPQGAFHEFLKGDAAERRRMLVRLLDLGRYDVAAQVARREATRLDAIIGERASLIEANYADATDERLAQLTAAAATVRERLTSINEAKQAASALAGEAAEAQRSIVTLELTSSQLGAALIKLRRLSSAWPSLETEDLATIEELLRAEQLVCAAQETLEEADQALHATVARAGDPATLTRLEEAAKAHAREQLEVARLAVELATAREAGARFAGELDDATERELQAKAVCRQMSEQRVAAEVQRQLAEAIMRCAAIEARSTALDGDLADANHQLVAAARRANQARHRLEHLEHEHTAVTLRAGLTAGDHCPVCDSIIKTVPRADADISETLGQAREVLARAELDQKSANEVVVAIETRQSVAGDELGSARSTVPDRTSIPNLTQAEAGLGHAQQRFSQANHAERESQQSIDEAARLVARANLAVATAAATVAALASHHDGAVRRLDDATATLTATFGVRLPDNLDGEIKRRRNELQAAQDAQSSASIGRQRATGARENASDARAGCMQQLSAFDRDLAAVTTAVRIAAEPVARTATDGLPSLPAAELERGRLVAAWLAFCELHAASVKAAVAQRRERLAQKVAELLEIAAGADIERPARRPDEIAAQLERAAVLAHGAAVGADKDVEALRTRIKERQKLEGDIRRDRLQCSLYKALAAELRADRFIAFMLEQSMNQLALQASDELLRISDGRYSLIAHEGCFEVIDHHNADEQRSVATLSGGETFLASLSLALALSVGLRELAGTASGRLETIFIDEGFGALDPETLEVVVDALERLRDGDRMVGVITHVPTLAERIPSGLLVEKNGGSSRILVR